MKVFKTFQVFYLKNNKNCLFRRTRQQWVDLLLVYEDKGEDGDRFVNTDIETEMEWFVCGFPVSSSDMKLYSKS